MNNLSEKYTSNNHKRIVSVLEEEVNANQEEDLERKEAFQKLQQSIAEVTRLETEEEVDKPEDSYFSI